MDIIVSGKTDKGMVRANNEDNFYIDEKRGLFVVADGMGGHASGEVASNMAIDVIRDYFDGMQGGRAAQFGRYQEKFSEETNRVGSAVKLANRVIYEAASTNPQWKGMGTTIAAVLLNGNRLSIAHVGDSRVYLVRAGSIEQLTDDHSVVYEQVRRELLTKEEAEKSEMRNILTRALGVHQDVEVDFDEMTLMENDVLILCTDGLNTMISDDEMLSVVMSTKDPVEACNRLVDAANKNGGKDNVTVITGYVIQKNWWSYFSKLMEWFRR